MPFEFKNFNKLIIVAQRAGVFFVGVRGVLAGVLAGLVDYIVDCAAF